MTSAEILELRTKLGLTQKELAGRLKVDFITISRWERDTQRPSAAMIKRIDRIAGKLKRKMAREATDNGQLCSL